MHSSSSAAGPATYRFGDFTFDRGSRQLLRNGVELHLSPKAHQLLAILLAARPRALSREELYDALWPSTFVCETNLAGVVNELRRCLGDDARAPRLVRTVHRFGYAFRGDVVVAAVGKPAAATLTCEGLDHPLSEGENVVGRASDGRIVLSHGSVSRQHAMIAVYDGEISIKDLGSKNGTYLDGRRIGSMPVAVTRSTIIEFGAVVASVISRKASSTAKFELNSSTRPVVSRHFAAERS